MAASLDRKEAIFSRMARRILTLGLDKNKNRFGSKTLDHGDAFLQKTFIFRRCQPNDSFTAVYMRTKFLNFVSLGIFQFFRHNGCLAEISGNICLRNSQANPGFKSARFRVLDILCSAKSTTTS